MIILGRTGRNRLDKSGCRGLEMAQCLALGVLLWLLKPQSGKTLETHRPPNDGRAWHESRKTPIGLKDDR